MTTTSTAKTSHNNAKSNTINNQNTNKKLTSDMPSIIATTSVVGNGNSGMIIINQASPTPTSLTPTTTPMTTTLTTNLNDSTTMSPTATRRVIKLPQPPGKNNIDVTTGSAKKVSVSSAVTVTSSSSTTTPVRTGFLSSSATGNSQTNSSSATSTGAGSNRLMVAFLNKLKPNRWKKDKQSPANSPSSTSSANNSNRGFTTITGSESNVDKFPTTTTKSSKMKKKKSGKKADNGKSLSTNVNSGMLNESVILSSPKNSSDNLDLNVSVVTNVEASIEIPNGKTPAFNDNHQNKVDTTLLMDTTGTHFCLPLQ